MTKEKAISVQLSECIALLRKWQKEYSIYSEKVGECDKVKNDLLHYIELDSCCYAERCRQATQLRQCLLERREYKDLAEEREPIAAFLSASQSKGLLDTLGQALGEVRKVEKYHNCRSYRPRSKIRVAEEKEKDIVD